MLVCPECGSPDFIEYHSRVVKVTVCIYDNGDSAESGGPDEILDDDRQDEFKCDDCRVTYYATDELCTEAEYNSKEDE